MALEITNRKDAEMADKYIVTERLYINAEGDKLVSEDSPEAAFVFATAGKEIPIERAQELGLVKAPAKKQAAKPADKKRTPAKNKGK